MTYRRAGRSGLQLPAISLGLWQNFGDDRPLDTQREILRRAFDLGVTHFDLANNYGPPYGSAEANFGTHLARRLRELPRRAGHLDQGGLRHVAGAVRRAAARGSTCSPPWTSRCAGWASTTSTSSTGTGSTRTRRSRRRWARSTPRCARARRCTPASRRTRRSGPARRRGSCAELGTPLLIHQPSYSMLNRWIEEPSCSTRSSELGIGCIAFSPLAQGLLTDRYLDGIPADSRAARGLVVPAS